MRYSRVILLLAFSALASCSAVDRKNNLTNNSTKILTVKPVGEKLSTLEYWYDARMMGHKRLKAILSSKAKSRYPTKNIVLFNLQITHDKRSNSLSEQLRNQGRGCQVSNSYRTNIVIDKGDQYQTSQPATRTTCQKLNNKRQLRVASIDIYQVSAP